MKVIVFTHKVDIDGLGGAVLCNLAFGEENVEYVLCMPYDINRKFNEYLKSGKLDKVDLIYVTDICMEEPLLEQIDLNNSITKKLIVLDHHIDKANTFKKNYNWITMKNEDKIGLVCGTYMLYEELKKSEYITPNEALDEFVELTRQYDTWEWKDKYNNEKARELTIYMDAVGEKIYIASMTEKLLVEKEKFNFSRLELLFIENLKEDIKEYVDKTFSRIIFKEIDGAKIAVLFAEKYRNEMKPEIYKRNLDVDAVVIYKLQEGTASWRSIAKDFEVIEIAKKYGGGGIKKAAGSKITKEHLEKIAEILLA